MSASLMKITHSPPGGPVETWEFDLSRLMVAELDAIERVTGLTGMVAFQEALNNWSASALRALIWVVRKRSDPPLRHDAVDFAIADISIVQVPPVPKDAAEAPSSNGASMSVAGG